MIRSRRAFWRLLFCVSFSFALTALAQKQGDPATKPIDPVQGEREARTLVAEMLAQKPEQTFTNGLLRIRDADGNEYTVTVRFKTQTTATNWSNTYESLPGKGANTADSVTIFHSGGGPNLYALGKSSDAQPRSLSQDETLKPFAGSDFWIVDLGFDFLHWPRQVIVKKEMSDSRSCAVLDSINPSPASGGYARVRSWITTTPPHAPVRAEAYDARGKKLKVFDVKGVERVKGQFQVDAVEMRNIQTDTRTIMEFDLGNQ